jgi:hypothetical protein
VIVDFWGAIEPVDTDGQAIAHVEPQHFAVHG